jgi:signal transduction histidine kinase
MGKKILAVWICLVLAIIAASYLFTYQEKLRLNLDRIAHTQETLSLIYDLQNNLAIAEAVTRGYVLTGEEGQLANYDEALKEIDRIFNQLKWMTAAEPEQQRLLGSLRSLIDQRLALFGKATNLRRQKGLDEPELLAVARAGTKIQNNIRKLLDKLEYSEKKLLVPQWAQEKKRTRIWLWGLASGTFLSFSLLLLTLYFLSREVAERRRAEENLVIQQEDLRSLASELTLAEERERRRIAVSLHDQIGQSLALSNIKLEEMRKSLPPGSEFLSAELNHIGDLMKQAIHDTKSLIFKISSPILYELGFEAAVQWLVEQIPKQHGILASFESDNQPKPLGEDIRVLLFQAVSELLVNVVKHAQARNLKVSMWRDGGQVQVKIDDDGVGFKMGKVKPRLGKYHGFGLFSIRERLKPFGGTLDVRSQPGSGTQVTLSVPVKEMD